MIRPSPGRQAVARPSAGDQQRPTSANDAHRYRLVRALHDGPTGRATDESACTPDSVPGVPCGTPAAAIHLGLPSPAGSSGLPAGSGGPPSYACAGRRLAAAALLGLAPGGVYRATPVTRGAGGLLPRRFTLTGHMAGGLISVALSRGSPRVAVSNHPALWSPDVPRRRAAARRRDRPVDSSVAPPS